jgi:hypothetical protein
MRTFRGWDELVTCCRRICATRTGPPPSVTRRAGSDQPWRCLWRGSVQITMTRPCRRITRHLLQILLTLGLTFTVALLPIRPGDAVTATPDVEDGHGDFPAAVRLYL